MEPAPADRAAGASPQRWPWQPLLALSLVAAVFAPSVGFGFVNWDDELHVLRNPSVLGHGTLTDLLLTPQLGYPIPLTVLLWKLEAMIAGLAPWLFHLTNVLLHLSSCVLVFRLARLLGLKGAGATVALLLFGLHPVAAEPVSWVTGGKDVLSCFLGLCATLVFFSASRDPVIDGARARRFAGLLLFVLAALAKPTALFLPLGWLLLLHHAWGQPWRRALRAITPALFPSMLILGLALVGQSTVGAIRGDRSAVVVLRQVWYALGYHLGLLSLAREPLAKHIPVSMPPSFEALVDLPPLLMVAALALWLRRGQVTPRGRVAVIGILWAGAAYSPSAGFVPLVRFLADSYLYSALVGLGWAVGSWFESVPSRLVWIRNAAIPVVSVALASVTLSTSLGWRDGVALWTRVHARYPDSPQVCRNLGNAYFERDRMGDALVVYQGCAATFGPTAFDKNIGITLVVLRRFAEADTVLTRAAARQPGDPVIARYLHLSRAPPPLGTPVPPLK